MCRVSRPQNFLFGLHGSNESALLVEVVSEGFCWPTRNGKPKRINVPVRKTAAADAKSLRRPNLFMFRSFDVFGEIFFWLCFAILLRLLRLVVKGFAAEFLSVCVSPVDGDCARLAVLGHSDCARPHEFSIFQRLDRVGVIV
jgi:hypothetical protein